MPWLTAAFVGVALAAEPAELSVQLKERGSGIPIGGTIRIDDDRQVEADERGRATLTLEPGRHTLVLFGPEHQLLEVVVEVPTKRSLKFFLDPLDDAELVIVETERERSAGTVTRSQRQLRETPGAFGDPVRAMEVAPSVAPSQFGDEGLVVRGAEPTTTAVRIDGIDVPWLYHWYFLRSVVDPSAIESLTLRPSGLPASQGGFAQGLLTVDLVDDADQPGFHGRASLDLLDASLSGTVRLSEQWSLFLGGRVSWGGELAGAITWLASDQQLYVPVRWNDYHARLVGNLGQHTLSVTALGAIDSLQAFGPDGTTLFGDPDDDLPYDPSRVIDHQFARLQLAWDTETDTFSQRTAVQVGRDVDASLLDGALSGAGALSLVGGPTFGTLDAWRLGFRHTNRVALTDALTLDSGLDADWITATDQNYGTLDDDGDPVLQAQDLGSFAPWTGVDLDTDHARLTLGFRGSTYLRNGEAAFVPEPRVNLIWRTSDTLSVTADLGASSQRPPVWQSSVSFGQPGLTPVFSWQGSAGTVWKPNTALSLTSTLYGSWFPSLLVKDIDQQAVITPESAPLYLLDQAPVYPEVQGASFGVEVQAQWTHLDKVELGGALTLGRALRFDGTKTWAAARDHQLMTTLWATWRPTPQWSFSTRGQVVGGAPYRDPNRPLGVDPTVRLPWFAQLDLRAARTFVGKRARWTLYADVFNATNTKLPLVAAVPPNGTRPVPFFFLGTIPNLGLEVTF